MNDNYLFCWLGHWEIKDERTGELRSGWKFWFLPNYEAVSGYGRKPEGFSIQDEFFAKIGGLDHFKPMLDKKVKLILRPNGRRMQLLDCVPVSEK